MMYSREENTVTLIYRASLDVDMGIMAVWRIRNWEEYIMFITANSLSLAKFISDIPPVKVLVQHVSKLTRNWNNLLIDSKSILLDENVEKPDRFQMING